MFYNDKNQIEMHFMKNQFIREFFLDHHKDCTILMVTFSIQQQSAEDGMKMKASDKKI
jgi:hypothetical protein